MNAQRGAAHGANRPQRLLLALLAISVALVGLPPLAAHAASPSTFFAFNSVGSFVGKTQNLFITPSTGGVGIESGATAEHIVVFAGRTDEDGLSEDWRLELTAANGGSFVEGVYDSPGTPGSAGLRLSGSGDGCNTSTATFEIHEMGWNGPTLIQLALTYEFRCDGDDGRGLVAGRVRVNSSVPLPAFQSPTMSREMASVVTGGTGAPRTYTLTVEEDLPVTFGTVAFTGTDAGSFHIGPDACSGQTFDPGESCTFDVAFTPEASGGRLAWLEIQHDGNLSPRRLPYWGIGLIPTATSVIGVEPVSEYPEDGVRYVFRVTPSPGGNWGECVIDDAVVSSGVLRDDGTGSCYAPRTIGSHTVRARYLESFLHAASELSDPATFLISNSTNTSLTASGTTAAPGEAITFTATVATASNLLYPGGQLVLRDGASGPVLVTRSVTRASPKLSFTTSSLAIGSHTIVASYNGVSGSLLPSSSQVGITISTPPEPVVRVAGADRYATAAGISAHAFAPGVPVAYVATGLGFADALAGGPIAARDGGPVLLVKLGSVPTSTATELRRLKPARIVILGGTAVVSNSVATTLAAIAPVSRIAGANRYETAARVADRYAPGVAVAYVATGANFPDALAGGPAAGLQRGPMLLLTSNGIPATTAQALDRLDPKRIVVLGGTSVISAAVAVSLDAYTTGDVVRRSGANRFETAVHVSKSTFPSASVAYLATGSNFPDALAGGPPAARARGPILLVTKDAIPSVVRHELIRLGVDTVVILGGTSAISSAVELELERLLAGGTAGD